LPLLDIGEIPIVSAFQADVLLVKLNEFIWIEEGFNTFFLATIPPPLTSEQSLNCLSIFCGAFGGLDCELDDHVVVPLFDHGVEVPLVPAVGGGAEQGNHAHDERTDTGGKTHAVILALNRLCFSHDYLHLKLN